MNICDFLAGIVEFLGIRTVITPPAVSIPRDNGVTSNNNMSCTFDPPVFVRTAPYIAAPYATASSGFIDLFGSLPLKYSWISYWIFGILVEPPTKTTS